MAKVGRPRNYSDDEIVDIKERLSKYIESEQIPIIAEFAYKNDIPRQTFYDYEEFSTLLKKLMDKKESQLEKLSLTGDVNTTMAIFSLKQLGWRDKQEHEISGAGGGPIDVNAIIRKAEEEFANEQRNTGEDSQ